MRNRLFKELCRQNTGIAMCDSGGENGRHWQQPPIPDNAEPLTAWEKNWSPSIVMAILLEKCYEPDETTQAEFDEWLKTPEAEDLNWFECATAFAKSKGLVKSFCEYTYNVPNDLSQDFQVQVYREDIVSCDPFYAHEGDLIAIFSHNGADARGGFSSPVWVKSLIDYVMPIDLSVEYHIEDARKYRRQKYRHCKALPLLERVGLPDPDPKFVEGPDRLSHADCQEIDQRWTCGYSREPGYHLEEDVARWFEFTRTRDSVCVQLNDGTIAKVTAEGPYLG